MIEVDVIEVIVDEEYVEDVSDDVDDGKVGVILLCIFFCSDWFFEKKNIGLFFVFKVIVYVVKKIFCLF